MRSSTPPAPARSATARSSSPASNAWCASAPARSTNRPSEAVALTLPAFAARCREILARDNGPAGRAEVAAALREALRDEAFVAAQFGPGAPERRVVHEDPDL